MPRNPGRRPGECAGRKVNVLLFSGWTNKTAIISDPWPADAPTDWTISDPPRPYQIKAWELA